MNSTVSGITKWLKHHRFNYKHPKAGPAKADLQKQEEFIEEYLALSNETAADEPIAQTAPSTRVNVMGAIRLAEVKVDQLLP